MELDKIHIDKSLVKLKYAIVIIFIFTFFVWIFYSHKSHWSMSNEYKQEDPIYDQQEYLSFYDVFYFNSLSYFTLGFCNFLPKNTSLKFFNILIMIFAYIIMFL